MKCQPCDEGDHRSLKGSSDQYAMEARVNPFDRLSDDLLGGIFEKLLWSPNDFGMEEKGYGRMWLESVCKRFQKLVHTFGCLDWQFDRPEDGDAFLCYIVRQQDRMSPLKKVALDVEGPTQLVAILQSVVIAAQDSLEELHVFVGDLALEDVINWEYVFLLFGALKRLRILEFLLWERETAQWCPVTLSRVWFSGSFRKLTSLTLYGFAIPGVESDSFLEKLSMLKSLELHSYSIGANASSKASALEKAFWWGDEEVGIDVADPANASLPRSMKKLVALMGSRFSDVSQKAVEILRNLLSRSNKHIAIAAVPGTLHNLVELLVDGEHTVAATLGQLAAEPANKSRIASVPGCLHKLLRVLEQRGSGQRHEAAAETLISLAGDAQVRKDIVGDPQTLRRLVGSLKDQYSGRASVMSGWVLWCLANPGDKDAGATSEMQGCVQKLVALLDAAGLGSHFGEVLSNLCKSPGAMRESVLLTPEFSRSLSSLVTSERVEIRTAVAESLETLASWDAESC
ncbi:hypothetical protein KFL_004190110 [Klebsormidium nitens]|uniref:Uncharacterized protein n=1 Tax=Klebsormidium nitens TaxID=105231 RepID=A0A1Y1IEF0_KLENI|nr:hypothetical protein KFL_004190110 [Klebsormidium nitens]|eukprot:GAQ88342.1 hypothetical protein KFL_004190110 [Klebsormidium nitens]